MARLDTLFFIHVPKTAGTSFRLAAEARLGEGIAYDYGRTAPQTTDFVRQHIYDEPDLDAFRQALQDREIALFGGHVPWAKYASIFKPRRTIAFMRAPIERLISEYHHTQRHGGFEGDLRSFADRPAMRNRQAEMLQGVRPRHYGCLGVSERYSESLQVIASELDLSLDALNLNNNPDRQGPQVPYEVDEQLLIDLRRWNQRDIALHAQAGYFLAERLGEPVADHPPPMPVRGKLGAYTDEHVVGWAAMEYGERAVEVRVLVDDRTVATVVANRPRPDLVKRGVHGTENVGFRVHVGGLPAGAQLRCLVGRGDSELPGSPLVVPTPE